MKAPTPSQYAALRTAEIGHSLDQRNPYTRSGQGYIVTEDDQQPMETSDLVLCIVGVAIMVLVVGLL